MPLQLLEVGGIKNIEYIFEDTLATKFKHYVFKAYTNRKVENQRAKQDIFTERKKKRRVNFIPKFHSSLKKFVKYFTMITKRYMYETKVPNFIGL